MVILNRGENVSYIYVILRNGKPYCGLKKQKTVKAYTSRGMAEGIISRETPLIATDEFRGLDIRYDEAYEIILNTIKSQFTIKEVEV